MSREYFAEGTEFHIGRIELVANTGTYVDAPFHRFPTGKDLSELPLASLADLPGIRITAGHDRAVDVQSFQGKDLAGKAVLGPHGLVAFLAGPRSTLKIHLF